jgi:hypothetical protein
MTNEQVCRRGGPRPRSRPRRDTPERARRPANDAIAMRMTAPA